MAATTVQVIGIAHRRLLSINAQIAATIAIFGTHHRWGPMAAIMAAMIGLSSWPGVFGEARDNGI